MVVVVLEGICLSLYKSRESHPSTAGKKERNTANQPTSGKTHPIIACNGTVYLRFSPNPTDG